MAAKALHLTKADIDEALGSGQIRLAYQPIFDLADGALVRVEGLVRWQHPRFGMVLPAVFLPVFEAEERLAALTRRVLERAAAEFGSWAFRRPSGLSINLSALDLVDPAMPAIISGVLTAVGIAPAKLTVECPVMNADPAKAAPILKELKALGVRLAAEMMTHPEDIAEAFKIAPFDEVKASGRGILRAARNNSAATLNSAADLIAYAEARGAITTAIGAEDEAACIALRTIGFHQVQANILSPALPIDAVTPRVTNAARQVLGFETRAMGLRQGQNAGPSQWSETVTDNAAPSAFYHERRRAQGDLLRKAAESRAGQREDAGEGAGDKPRARVTPLRPPEAPGGEAHPGDEPARPEAQIDKNEPAFDARKQQEALMQADSKAGLLMRPDLAATSLGYGQSPLRRSARRRDQGAERPADKEVAPGIKDVLGALPVEVTERTAPLPPESAPDTSASPEDRLDAEIAKLPTLPGDLPLPSGQGSPVHEDLAALATKLRQGRYQPASLLQRRYRLKITHFWPKPWKKAYLRLMEQAGAGAAQDRGDVVFTAETAEQGAAPNEENAAAVAAATLAPAPVMGADPQAEAAPAPDAVLASGLEAQRP